MSFLHEVGLIHRDLKSGNVLVDQNWNCSLIDFGISRVVSNNMTTKNLGTPLYCIISYLNQF